MSNSPIRDLDQDYEVISTEVTVGKSYKSRGWALSRNDIHDWIPVEEFERNCKVIINDISSDAILRFNPRLFYESDELSSYLEDLHYKGYSKYKIPMDIIIPKNNFFRNIDSIEKYLKVETVDTSLLVGKSFSSKGWQLSKELVSKLFPAEEYAGEYSIIINNINSNAKLNLQFRLFYKSNELSEYLEELHYENPRNKIPAKIIFDNYDESFINVEVEDNNVVPDDIDKGDVTQKSCKNCSQSYSIDQSNFDEMVDLCPVCIEKIQALKEYNNIKNSSLSKFVKKEFIEEKLGSNFNEIWNLLLKYDFLVPFGELYKLNGNDSLEQNFSKFLQDDEIRVSPKKRNRDKILELIKEPEETNEETVCIICERTLADNEIDRCELCNDKLLATEYLHEIVNVLPYGKHFSKLDVNGLNLPNLNTELVLNKLVKYELLLFDGYLSYKLNDVTFLNEFIDKFAKTPYVLQVNYESDGFNIQKISKNDLSSEERIDSLIKWKNYSEYIAFKKGQYGFMSVQFKQEGTFLYSKGFSTSYEAKIEAINYLKSLGKLILVDDAEIKLEIK